MMGTVSCFFVFLPHDKSWKTPMLKMKTLNPIPNFNFCLSLKCHYSTSQQNQFTISYLVTNLGFSLETATRASKSVRFKTSEKPDTVIATFRNFGFSDSQISYVVSKAPDILTCNPYKRILPKFEFLFSKGASNSDVVEIVVRSPRILYASLDNRIIPTFEWVRRFFPSDDEVIQYLLKYRCFYGYDSVANNVKLLLDHGVTESNIRHLLLRSPSILSCYDLRKPMNRVKEMGSNDPSNVNVSKALLGIRSMTKSQVFVYKKWGWSDEMVLEAFRKRPVSMLSSEDKINKVMSFWVNELGWSDEMVLEAFRKRPVSMLSSEDKINKVMTFWVNELGWNSSALVKRVEIFSYSLENRIIPRGCVISYLISKGLIEKNVELSTPFAVSEKMFLEMYVQRFKEERHNLLKLYQEKMGGKKIEENGEVSVSY